MTTAEVALVLRETRENTSRRCKRGEIKAVRVGRKYLISQAALDAFLTPAPQPEPVAEPAYRSPRQKRALQQSGRPFLTTRQKRQAEREGR